jgi:hypothetical protein
VVIPERNGKNNSSIRIDETGYCKSKIPLVQEEKKLKDFYNNFKID